MAGIIERSASNGADESMMAAWTSLSSSFAKLAKAHADLAKELAAQVVAVCDMRCSAVQ